MDHKKIFTILLSFWSIIAFAQPLEVISSAGNHFNNSSGSISFTIGECIISTANSATLILTQGFQQPILVFVDPTSITQVGDYILARSKMGDVIFGKLTRQDSWYVEIACLMEDDEPSESNRRYVKMSFDKTEIQYCHKIRMMLFQ